MKKSPIFSMFWMVCLSVLGWCVAMPVAWAQDAKGGFVWQVTAPNQTQSYLIGTIHMGKTGSALPKSYQTALQQTRLLVVESNPENFEGVSGLAQFMALQAMMQDTQILKQHWGAARIAKLNQILQQNDSDFQLQENAKVAPWVMFMRLLTDYNAPNYSMDYGIDMLLMQQAKSNNQAILSLETLEPMAAFMAIESDVMLRALDAYIENHAAQNEETMVMLKQYERQDSEAFVADVLNQDKGVRYFPAQDREFWRQWLYEDLLHQRNATWLPKLQRHLQQQPTTVAVGAGHLFGSDGLIAMLRAKGFKVEPVL